MSAEEILNEKVVDKIFSLSRNKELNVFVDKNRVMYWNGSSEKFSFHIVLREL